MIQTLVKPIIELFVALESAPVDLVDPDWSTEQLELLFSLLAQLKPAEQRKLKAIAEEIASCSQAQEGHSRRTQLLLSFCDQISDET